MTLKIPRYSDVPSQVQRPRNLPPVPEVLLTLLKMFEHHENTLQEYADIIIHDPALSFRIMQVANTGRRRPVYYEFRKPASHSNMAGELYQKIFFTDLSVGNISSGFSYACVFNLPLGHVADFDDQDFLCSPNINFVKMNLC